MNWREHVGLVIAATISLFASARLLVVARFDVNTAATILQTAGVGTVLAGTTLTVLPFVLVLATIALAVTSFIDPSLSPLSREGSRMALTLALALTLCLVGPALAFATIGLTAVLAGCVKHRLRWRV
jgi:hypothetical protein